MLKVTSIQRGCVYDGEGIRTTIFLHGCHLSCPWCCNPETWSDERYIFNRSKCLHYSDIKSRFCENCKILHGTRDLSTCSFGAASQVYQEMSCEEIMEICLRDFSTYQVSGGGITFSGGEPLLQSQNLRPLLKQLYDKSISVTFETTLCVPTKNFTDILDFNPHVILDLKLQSEMFLRDSQYIALLRKYIHMLNQNTILYRLVFVDSMNGCASEIIDKLSMLGVNKIELLKAHNLGKGKYESLNLPYKDFTANDKLYEQFTATLRNANIRVSQLKL